MWPAPTASSRPKKVAQYARSVPKGLLISHLPARPSSPTAPNWRSPTSTATSLSLKRNRLTMGQDYLWRSLVNSRSVGLARKLIQILIYVPIEQCTQVNCFFNFQTLSENILPLFCLPHWNRRWCKVCSSFLINPTNTNCPQLYVNDKPEPGNATSECKTWFESGVQKSNWTTPSYATCGTAQTEEIYKKTVCLIFKRFCSFESSDIGNQR